MITLNSENFIRSKYIKHLEYVFVIITFLQYYSVFSMDSNGIYSLVIKVSWHLLILLLILIFGLYDNRKLESNFILFLFLFFLFTFSIFMLNMIHYELRKAELSAIVINPLLLIILFYFMNDFGRINDILYKFEDTTLFFSIISLILWAIAVLGMQPNMFISTIWGSSNTISISSASFGLKHVPGIFFLQFFPQGNGTFLGINILKNSGMFMEGTIYASILSISLLIDLFIRNNKNIINYKVIILFLTILTTGSVNGMIVSIIALFYALFLNVNNNIKMFYMFLVIPLIILLYVILNTKINSGNTNSVISSFDLRMDDIKSTIDAWQQHLFIGNGYDNYQSITNHMAFWRFLINGGGNGVSIGFTVMLAYGGLMLGAFYLCPTILTLSISYRLFGFAVILFLLFILEGLEESYIYTVILSYLWIRYVCNYKI